MLLQSMYHKSINAFTKIDDAPIELQEISDKVPHERRPCYSKCLYFKRYSSPTKCANLNSQLYIRCKTNSQIPKLLQNNISGSQTPRLNSNQREACDMKLKGCKKWHSQWQGSNNGEVYYHV